MKTFALDPLTGDVIVENNNIKYSYDDEITIQKCKSVLSTNLGEWELNEKEGINFRNILTKNPNYDLIENTILSGLIQVDNTFRINDFVHSLNDRKLKINFTATNENGERVKTDVSYER
jgi:hypothetical protein